MSTTAAPCPSWCTTDHQTQGTICGGAAPASESAPIPVRLGRDGDRSFVAAAGELLTEAEAHELGLALVRAADALRRQAVSA